MAKTQIIKNIIGLKIDVVDENTGAPAGFHIINDLHIGVVGGYATATLASYYNQKLYQAGKHPLGAGTSITLYGTPPRGEDVLDWAYRSIAASIAPDATDPYGNSLQAHQFMGAELISDVAETTAAAG